jgi:hypothetical protein
MANLSHLSDSNAYWQATIWDFFNKQKSSQLSISNQTLEELHLQMDQEVCNLVRNYAYEKML